MRWVFFLSFGTGKRKENTSKKKMKRFLSFDLGYKNLAFCVVDHTDETFLLRHWRVDDIVEGHTKAKKPTIEILVKCLVAHLENIEPLVEGVTDVLIEIQPVGFHRRSNTPMKVLSHVIQGYYCSRGKGLNVAFVSPKQKLKLPGCPDTKALKTKERYAAHKKFAVEKCRELLTAGGQEDMIALFAGSKKKDDLADCFLQAYTKTL